MSGRALLGVALLLIVGLAVWLVGYSSAQTLALAESLRFQRMQVAHLGETGTFRFFFVTNRVPDTRQTDGAAVFLAEREPEIHVGIFDTEIEPALGFGMLVNPTDWFQNEEIRLRRVQTLAVDAFLESLRLQVEASPRRSLLINVNGFRERFDSALRKTAFLAHVLDIDTPLLVFDWPGNQGSTIRGYRRAQRIARESGAELAETLQLILEEVSPDNVWLTANSMGGEVVAEAFALLYQDPAFQDAELEFDHVVLTAPDVGHQEFADVFKEQIGTLSRRMTVYVSSNDQALLMSRVLNRARRLGESTADPAAQDQVEEAAVVFAALSPDDDQGLTLVDMTPVNRTRNFHNFSLETPEYFDDLFLRLSVDDRPVSRSIYPVAQPDGRIYWILTRGR